MTHIPATSHEPSSPYHPSLLRWAQRPARAFDVTDAPRATRLGRARQHRPRPGPMSVWWRRRKSGARDPVTALAEPLGWPEVLRRGMAEAPPVAGSAGGAAQLPGDSVLRAGLGPSGARPRAGENARAREVAGGEAVAARAVERPKIRSPLPAWAGSRDERGSPAAGPATPLRASFR